MMRSRGQSSTVATVLLVGIVFVIAGGIYVVGSGVVEDATREPTTAAVSLEANSSTLVVTHRAGDALAYEDTVVVVSGSDGSTNRIRLSSVEGKSDGQLTPGERIEIPYVASTPSFTVRLIDEANEQLLREWDRTVSIPGLELTGDGAGVTRSSINSGSNSGEITFSDGGRTLSIEGNQWVQSSESYRITPKTRLSVTFESTSVCEIHAIGFADQQNSDRMIRLAGSQPWGTSVAEFDASLYQQGDGTIRYEIPIGQYYEQTGVLDGPDAELTAKLTLTNDCDGSPPSGSPVQSTYGAIRIQD